jgi:hypothetical protein
VFAAVRVVAPAVAVVAEEADGHHLVDDAGELARRLAALHLRLPGGAPHVVGDALENADEDHGLALGMLQVLQQPDHLPGEQPVGAAGVRLAGLVGEGLRPALRPGHRLPGQVGDRVDEDRALGCDQLDQVGMGSRKMPVVRLGEERVLVRCRVDAADQAGDV